MVDVRTSQVYLSGYAGGRWLYPLSNELSFERIFQNLFDELSAQVDERARRGPAAMAAAPTDDEQEG